MTEENEKNPVDVEREVMDALHEFGPDLAKTVQAEFVGQQQEKLSHQEKVARGQFLAKLWFGHLVKLFGNDTHRIMMVVQDLFGRGVKHTISVKRSRPKQKIESDDPLEDNELAHAMAQVDGRDDG